jgi:hypothetical protein
MQIMRTLVSITLIAFPISIFCQIKENAVGRYSERGDLISISNLTGLSDCTAANIEVKVGKVKKEGDLARAAVMDGKSKTMVSVPLDRLKPDDRVSIFNDLVRKKLKVRIGGYRCSDDDPITAFSIDRLY